MEQAFSFGWLRPVISRSRGQDIARRQAAQAGRMAKHGHLGTGRAPDLGDGVAPQDNAGQAQRGGQVRDAGIVADESGAALEQAAQFRQRQALGQAETRRRQGGRQALEAFGLGLAADEQKVEGVSLIRSRSRSAQLDSGQFLRGLPLPGIKAR